MSVVLWVIILISAFSILVFSRPEWQAKLMLNPYRVVHHKEYYRTLTSGLIHNGYLHLFFNMFTLYFFGEYLGWFLGDVHFLMLFGLGIIAADLPTLYKHHRQPHYNSLGASGGVAAVVFASILYEPVSKICLYGILCLPGFILGALYLIYSYYQSKQSADHINHDAHFSGAVFGLLYAAAVEPAAVPAFFQKISTWSIF